MNASVSVSESRVLVSTSGLVHIPYHEIVYGDLTGALHVLEFWLYHPNSNPKQFPLGRGRYPYSFNITNLLTAVTLTYLFIKAAV